jgi:hypothetical protein
MPELPPREEEVVGVHLVEIGGSNVRQQFLRSARGGKQQTGEA